MVKGIFVCKRLVIKNIENHTAFNTCLEEIVKGIFVCKRLVIKNIENHTAFNT